MNIVWVLFLVVFHNGVCLQGIDTNVSRRPAVVNIGAVLSFNTTIGRVARVAINTAVEDVNSDPSVLGGTKLSIKMPDMNYSGFVGIIEALKFMGSDTVAIIGPQSTVTAHVISFVANELQVPLLSYSATDPTLASLQFPFFVMTSQNDLFQMTAIADIVDHYGWREVIAIFADDDYGRNGIAALGDKLAAKRCKISYKAALSPWPNRQEITDMLVQVALTESRILVLHASLPWGPIVFSVAKYLGMMGDGYVWIATNWLSTLIDTNHPLPAEAMDDIQGVLTFRMYTPDSELKRKFVSRWSNLTSKLKKYGSIGLNTYGLYAYDTVWLLARAIEAFFDQGGNISFSNDSRLINLPSHGLHLDAMSIFDGGKLLLQNIFDVNMTGVTGQIKFDQSGTIVRPAYDVINVIGTGYRKIGYWSNYSGLSVLPPETFYSKLPNRSSSSQKLRSVIWPGEAPQKPRGWVFPNNGRHLRIGIPIRVSYQQFVSQVPGTELFTGYCIDVFTAAINMMPYAVPYKLIPFGDGINNPSSTELVRSITAGVFDAAVGDIAIITNRTRMADFTQPYIESGLVVVAPVRKTDSDAWAFLQPFSRKMWLVTAVFFIAVGVVVWIMEHRKNDEFRGPPRRQFITILCMTAGVEWRLKNPSILSTSINLALFSFSTWFFAHRENVVSSFGRIVLVIWLFVVLIINSSYTASLTSILTVQKLSSNIEGIDTLRLSKDRIGYQQGSFARDYLINELGIDESRLVPLKLPEDIAKALKDGPEKGVAAVVDQRAYLELFLSTRCEFSIIGPEFAKIGWGFVSQYPRMGLICLLLYVYVVYQEALFRKAFPKDSPLVVDMSTAILRLSESGDLQRIHDKWLMSSACSSQGTKLDVDRLRLKSFWGLYLVCGLASLLALCTYLIMVLLQYAKRHQEEPQPSGSSSTSARVKTFLTFADEKEEEVKKRSKRRQLEKSSNGSKVETVGSFDSMRRFVEIPSNRCHEANEEA